MRKESLGNKLADSDGREFWKEIKGVSNAKMPLPTSIEGVTGESNIASVWRDHSPKRHDVLVPVGPN